MTPASSNQPICPTCFAAVEVGRNHIPTDPQRMVDGGRTDPCFICGRASEGVRLDVNPTIAGVFQFARREP